MAEIDTQKDVYLFLHGRMDLKEKATNALTAKGFAADKVTMALPTKSWRSRRLHGNVMDASKPRSHQDSTNYQS